MRIKKKHIREKINPELIRKQTRDVVDAVKSELSSDDKTAVGFIKSMSDTVSEDEHERAGRGIEYDVRDPEVEPIRHDIPTKSFKNRDLKHNPDLPFEGVSLGDDFETSGRGINFGVTDPEVGEKTYIDRMPPSSNTIKFGEKNVDGDLPFEGVKPTKIIEGRRIIKTMTVKDLKNNGI